MWLRSVPSDAVAFQRGGAAETNQVCVSRVRLSISYSTGQRFCRCNLQQTEGDFFLLRVILRLNLGGESGVS